MEWKRSIQITVILLAAAMGGCGCMQADSNSGQSESVAVEEPAAFRQSQPETPQSSAAPQKTGVDIAGERIERGSLPVEDGEIQLGTEEECARWEKMVDDCSDVAKLKVVAWGESGPLTMDETERLLSDLRAISPGVLEELGNPATGGSHCRAAYDEEDAPLWAVKLTGDWFVVQFGDEPAQYVFDMEGQPYDNIMAIAG